MKFRRKPLVVDAVQLLWSTWSEMCVHAGVGSEAAGQPHGVRDPADKNDQIMMDIPTPLGVVRAVQGDWVIRGDGGILVVYSDENFKHLYEPVPTCSL